MTTKTTMSLSAEMFLTHIFYSGPWDRLDRWLLGIRPDATLRWEIPENPTGVKLVLSKASEYAEYRDRVWRAKYALRHRNPPEVWKRGNRIVKWGRR